MPNDSQILLVNSDPSAHLLLRSCLTAAGYHRILEVSCGLSAVKLLRTTPIDLLITEIDLLALDGWRLARLVRSGIFPSESVIPIIMVAKTWCERIAETTAREFGINYLLPMEQCERLPEVIESLAAAPAEAFRNPRVLVVEDQADTAQIANRILRQRFTVEIAVDGASGLDAWRQGRHDLVLLDVMLPKMSGPDVLREILRLDPHQPVVIMTAFSTIDLAEELMLEGAADFIAKPFRAEQLRRVCELAARREDYMVSNAQFAARLQSVQESTEAFRKISATHQRLLDNLSTVVLELDSAGQLQFLNRAWTRLTGYSVEESLGRPLSSFLANDGEGGPNTLQAGLGSLLSNRLDDCCFELRLIANQGQAIWAECKLDAIASKSSGRAILGCLDNISERKQAQQELEFRAMHDYLTGLYNRHYFDNALRQMAATSARGNGRHALIYLDLDHFKVINDHFGHQHGDMILREIAALLLSRTRQADILCRVGGDEYALLLSNTIPAQALRIADEIRQLIQGVHCQVAGQQLGVSCSIGLSDIDGSATNPEDYQKQADIALYVAKRRGRNRVHLYDPEDRESDELRTSIDWTRRLGRAIEQERLLLHFQPVLHIASQSIAHYEALVRIDQGDEGLILPSVFIPALERAGAMAQLDHWVVNKSIALLQQNPCLHRVAINLSAQAFCDDALVPLVEELLRTTDVTPDRIIFELTESASMSNLAATQRMIKRLNELGCSFSVDDFGTGFSTFGYLKQFPAECIKIDGSFIVHLDRNPVDQSLVRAISEVARALGKQTVAEFVESAAVLKLVQTLGIDYAQGYFVGRPLPLEEILAVASKPVAVGAEQRPVSSSWT